MQVLVKVVIGTWSLEIDNHAMHTVLQIPYTEILLAVCGGRLPTRGTPAQIASEKMRRASPARDHAGTNPRIGGWDRPPAGVKHLPHKSSTNQRLKL